MKKKIEYLQVTHIPFFRKSNGNIVLDEVWAKDILSLSKEIGPVRVVAPQLKEESQLITWGPTAIELNAESNVSFTGLPVLETTRQFWKWPRVLKILYEEVNKADIVHSSNWFPPYLILYKAHEYAARLEKKTVFVVAEDFYDMLSWEWVRTSAGQLERWRRQRTLDHMESKVIQAVSKASLSFLHTPSVVLRYRNYAKNGTAIRLPTHEKENVINASDMLKKETEVLAGDPLVICVASRHKPLKGIDYFIRAVAELKAWKVPVKAMIYGEGPQTAELQALAHSLNLDDSVFFQGVLKPGKALFETLGKAHLFLMPHVTHDFGRTFFDALTGGAPVIAFRTPASVETVRDGIDGLLVPLDNVISLALAVKWCHLNRQALVRMSHEARSRALTETKEVWQKYRCGRILELF